MLVNMVVRRVNVQFRLKTKIDKNCQLIQYRYHYDIMLAIWLSNGQWQEMKNNKSMQ